MSARVFIDGDAGTTGLQIRARLAERRDVEILRLPDGQRKDPAHRARLLNAADLVILCLPDEAAREAVSLIESASVKVIDASTAHRTQPGWVYGFPEMAPGQAPRIAGAARVSNPGCYPTAAIALIRPLVEAGLLPADAPVTVNAVSGYSGGGRKRIQSFEDPGAAEPATSTYRAYGLGLEHKHVEEMRQLSGLTHPPLFAPSIARFHQGMMVQVPLQLWALPGSPKPRELHAALAERYGGRGFVSVAPPADDPNSLELDPEALNGTNDMRLQVFGNERREQALLVAILDNLGKGASGAAVQNMNLMLDLAPEAGLEQRLVA